jgi:hypothetical protein
VSRIRDFAEAHLAQQVQAMLSLLIMAKVLFSQTLAFVF